MIYCITRYIGINAVKLRIQLNAVIWLGKSVIVELKHLNMSVHVYVGWNMCAVAS